MIDIEDVKIIKLGPGQVLVVKCDVALSNEMIARLREKIEGVAPMLKDRLLIIGKEISLAVVDA